MSERMVTMRERHREYSKKDKKKQDFRGKNNWNQWKNRAAGIFVFLILSVFPLAFHDKYIDILSTKYQFYYIAVILLAAAELVFAAEGRIGGGKTAAQKRRWTLPETVMIFFVAVVLISTLGSEYRYESFWGNEGRYNGGFLWIIYGAAFCLIIKNLKFYPGYVEGFLYTGILVCFFGIMDYLGVDILGLERGLRPDIGVIFTSTIGNVNYYTSYVSMVAGAAAVLYGRSEKGTQTLKYGIFLAITFLALITGQSDSAYLAVLALFGALPFFLCGRRYGGWRLASAVSLFLSALLLVKLAEAGWPDRNVRLDGLFRLITGGNFLFYTVLAAWISSILLRFFESDQPDGILTKWFLRGWIGFLVLISVFLTGLIVDINLTGHGDMYGGAANYLLIGEAWGNNRGYAWKQAFQIYKDFSWYHKLFGYGPETFGILMVEDKREVMMETFGFVFDDVHNEYLQYLVTTGVLGLLCYLTLLGSSLASLSKKAGEEPFLAAILTALICYHVQAVVNINVPIVAPIMWTLTAAGLAAVKKKGNRSLAVPEIRVFWGEHKT